MMQKSVIDIFQRTLKILHEKQYITEQIYQDVTLGFQRLVIEEKERMGLEAKSREEERKSIKPKEIIAKKVKKTYSPEQLRERNLGVLLYLGVFLLLVGGLFVATSNWQTMQDWMKAGTIFFVSLLFFGFALLSKIIIKIDRTALAFFVLGSLFLPIGFLSISYLQLAGNYLSIHGDGKYLLGVIAGLILLPIYFSLSVYLHSSLYKVLTLLTITGSFGFLLAYLNITKDGFFFFMVIYHFIILFVLLKSHRYTWIHYLEKELKYIFQAQLILITILMAFIYDNGVMNGLQYLLVGGLFLMTIALSKRKNDHFLITITIAMGLYRIFTTPLLTEYLPLAFAVFSILLLSFVFLLKGIIEWGKIWEVTSLIISIGTFLYSIIFYIDSFLHGNIFLVGTYFLLAIQFIMVSRKVSYPIIRYLPSLFFSFALWHVALLLELVSDIHSFILVVYGIQFLLLLGLGIFNNQVLLQTVRIPSFIYHFSWMFGITFLAGTFFIGKWYVPILVLGVTFSLLYSFKLIKKKDYREILSFSIPISVACIYITTAETIPLIQGQGIPLTIAIAAIITILTVKVYKKIEERITDIAYYIGQAMYILALFLTLQNFNMNQWVITSLHLVGIIVFLDFYRKKKNTWIVWMIGVVSCISYVTLVASIWSNEDYLFTNFIKYGWIGIFAIAFCVRKTVFKYPFLTVSHIYLLGSIVVYCFVFGDNGSIAFLFAAIAYIVTVRLVKNKYWKMALFYASYLSCYFFLATWIKFDFAGGNSYKLAFLLVSILLFILYLIKSKEKQGISYFLIPFSILGIFNWFFASPFSIFTYFVIIIYIAIALVVMYFSKLHLFSLIGVLMIFINNEVFMYSADFMSFDHYLMEGIWGALFLFISSVAYPTIYSWKKEKWVDFYLLGSVLSVVSLYFIDTIFIWDMLIPGLFLSILFYVQRKRVEAHFKWIPSLISLFILLQPYYSLIEIISIPSLLVMESYVLPWIFFFILAKRIAGKFANLFKVMEWIVIICIAAILAIDGWVSHTIQDAIILGSLAVLSIALGFYFRYKSYFFTGIGVLILNVMLQTKPLWGNFPWWVYLLLAGSILILIASIYEMQKQGKRVEIFFKVNKWCKKVIVSLKSWR